MPPSLVSPYTPRVGTQILLTDLYYLARGGFFYGCLGRRADAVSLFHQLLHLVAGQRLVEFVPRLFPLGGVGKADV